MASAYRPVATHRPALTAALILFLSTLLFFALLGLLRAALLPALVLFVALTLLTRLLVIHEMNSPWPWLADRIHSKQHSGKTVRPLPLQEHPVELVHGKVAYNSLMMLDG